MWLAFNADDSKVFALLKQIKGGAGTASKGAIEWALTRTLSYGDDDDVSPFSLPNSHLLLSTHHSSSSP
jgi:hypothetical protein